MTNEAGDETSAAGNDWPPTSTQQGRNWVPWAVAGGTAVAIAVAAAFIVPPLLSNAAMPAETPPATTTPTPDASETPAAPSCDPTVAASVPNHELDLSESGDIVATVLAEIDSHTVDRSQTNAYPADDDHVALLTSAESGSVSTMHLSVVDADGSLLWTHSADGSIEILATEASSGVAGAILVGVTENDEFTLMLLDTDTGAGITQRVSPQVWSVDAEAGRTSAAPVIAEQQLGAYFVTDFQSAMRLDPTTLEVVWSVSGEDVGATRYEGGGYVMSVVDDVVFVGAYALDAETGEPLGWEREGAPLVGAGVALWMPLQLDFNPSPTALTAVDVSTGEACWATDVFDLAADDEALWVINSERAVQRLDPLTGEVLETRGTVAETEWTAAGTEDLEIDVVGGIVVTSARSAESSMLGEVAIHGTDGIPVEAPENGNQIAASNGQLIVFSDATATAEAELQAFDATDGAALWTTKVGNARLHGGMLVASERMGPAGGFTITEYR